jgi:hypothetical protein
MRIYKGWVLGRNNQEWTIVGANKIRTQQWYLLEKGDDQRHMRREELIEGLESGVIKYLRSVKL